MHAILSWYSVPFFFIMLPGPVSSTPPSPPRGVLSEEIEDLFTHGVSCQRKFSHVIQCGPLSLVSRTRIRPGIEEEADYLRVLEETSQVEGSLISRSVCVLHIHVRPAFSKSRTTSTKRNWHAQWRGV